MPDARLQKMRDVYPEQPQWRRPSDNAAERLKRGLISAQDCPRCGMLMWQPKGRVPVCVSPFCTQPTANWNTIETGDQH